MPIYEYRCGDCGKTFQTLILSAGASVGTACPRCGSANLTKLVSRVAVFRSEDSRLEGLADPSRLSGLDENDPKSMARWMKKMGREMGDDLGDGFEEEIDQAVEEAEREKAGEGEGGGDDDLTSGDSSGPEEVGL
ncbi:MAG: zinc ribbon domain-containing protein [Candidatus Aminicenantes bacterium]|nr:zinc ribbon domain-containing protein [Candidatus Aminicenantes bacterium]